MNTLEWMLLGSMLFGMFFSIFVPSIEGSPKLFRTMSSVLAVSSAVVLGMHL
jgi:hypothetical protein